MANFFTRLFGSKNSRELRRMQKIVERVNALEASFSEDVDLHATTKALRERAGRRQVPEGPRQGGVGQVPRP